MILCKTELGIVLLPLSIAQSLSDASVGNGESSMHRLLHVHYIDIIWNLGRCEKGFTRAEPGRNQYWYLVRPKLSANGSHYHYAIHDLI